jgi:hypothetical protein
LNLAGATGGPQPLRTLNSFFGINDSHGGNPFGTRFNQSAMTMFKRLGRPDGQARRTTRRAAIARGQTVFNTKTIRISGVRGVNDALGVRDAERNLHDLPHASNVGNHTDILPLDLGLINPAEGDNVLPVFRITAGRRAFRRRSPTWAARSSRASARTGQDEGAHAAGAVGARAVLPQRVGRFMDEVISFYDRPLPHRFDVAGGRGPEGVPAGVVRM